MADGYLGASFSLILPKPHLDKLVPYLSKLRQSASPAKQIWETGRLAVAHTHRLGRPRLTAPRGPKHPLPHNHWIQTLSCLRNANYPKSQLLPAERRLVLEEHFFSKALLSHQFRGYLQISTLHSCIRIPNANDR